jgi:signal transduction histidine kinase
MKNKNLNNNLFISTRFKLDIIASLFLFFILGFFSFAIYKLLTLDLIYQISPVFRNSDVATYVNVEKLFADFRSQTIFLLIVSDVVVFSLSIFFFDRLVKKMLTPIEYLSNIQKRFAENISHELRTPLSIINMQGEILLSKIEKEELGQHDEHFINKSKASTASILVETQNIKTLIEDLLFEARIKYGEDKVEDITISKLRKILEKVLEDLSYIKKPEVETLVEVNLDGEKLIRANPLHLERIFNNILSNSFKFTEKGQVKISISEHKVFGKSHLKLIFFDTGVGEVMIGLPAEDEANAMAALIFMGLSPSSL